MYVLSLQSLNNMMFETRCLYLQNNLLFVVSYKNHGVNSMLKQIVWCLQRSSQTPLQTNGSTSVSKRSLNAQSKAVGFKVAFEKSA